MGPRNLDWTVTDTRILTGVSPLPERAYRAEIKEVKDGSGERKRRVRGERPPKEVEREQL